MSNTTLNLASQIVINLAGDSPRYRGAGYYFGPYMKKEPEYVGASVHICTHHVDGGTILETVQAHLKANDRPGAVLGRCVMAGSEVYKRIVSDLAEESVIQRTSQDLSTEREFKAAMRGSLAELRVAWLIHHGLIRNFVASQLR